jgi:CheY-like chemotaxis protein
MHHGARRILVVEDDADLRGALVALLEDRRFSVVEAEHGGIALQRLRSGGDQVSLILLDLFMPEMNGWAFLDEQRKDPALARIPVVVLSADVRAARRAVGASVVGTMVKPIEFERLVELIESNC